MRSQSNSLTKPSRDSLRSSQNDLLLPLLASEGYANCQYLIMQTMSFETVPKTIFSRQCPYDYHMDEDLWTADPCCNYALQQTQCCAETERSVPVAEANVNVLKLASYCNQYGPEMLPAIIIAAKTYVDHQKDALNPVGGCLGEKVRTRTKSQRGAKPPLTQLASLAAGFGGREDRRQQGRRRRLHQRVVWGMERGRRFQRRVGPVLHGGVYGRRRVLLRFLRRR
ncbi:hypothetical protein TL16_g00403 [Triparma laevis f. inornata]|uniref:Uncharacterized protein n=1 Tax=Triparma laevis f. inornata TaxID=1714386 RepID=A0A9W6ZCT0_9STRA|nr:hypothetical protein TL16_g00403 [Triparma laevis f. inornata]